MIEQRRIELVGGRHDGEMKPYEDFWRNPFVLVPRPPRIHWVDEAAAGAAMPEPYEYRRARYVLHPMAEPVWKLVLE